MTQISHFKKAAQFLRSCFQFVHSQESIDPHQYKISGGRLNRSVIGSKIHSPSSAHFSSQFEFGSSQHSPQSSPIRYSQPNPKLDDSI